jgi:hypothetical protein
LFLHAAFLLLAMLEFSALAIGCKTSVGVLAALSFTLKASACFQK